MKNKTYFIFFSIVILTIFFLNQKEKNNVRSIHVHIPAEVQISKLNKNKSIKKIKRTKKSSKKLIINNSKKQSSRWEKVADVISNRYKKQSKAWTKITHQKFIHQYYLSEEIFNKYLEIRVDYENEIIDSNGHLYHLNNDNHNHNHNHKKNKKDRLLNFIKLKYQKKIKKILGEKKFSNYSDSLNKFNQIERANAQDGFPHFIFDL